METQADNAASKCENSPNCMPTVSPHLVCDGAAEAMEFYKKAFGAVEMMKMDAPNGKLMHGAMTIGGSMIMLMDENLEWGAIGPKTLKGSPVTIHLQVPDADALFQQAVDAGATVKMAVDDMFWGDRYGVLEDPYGHSWSIATHVRDVSPEEMKQAVAAMSETCQGPN